MRAGAIQVLLSLAACAVASGCVVGLRMQTPRDLAGVSDVVEATGRSQFGAGLFTSEDFQLGPYRVSGVDRGWSRVDSNREPWYIEGRKIETRSDGGFSFSFETAAGSLAGACETARVSERLNFGSWSIGDDNQSLGCRCRRGGSIVSSLFVADAGAGTQWEGRLDLGDSTYRVKGQRRLEGGKTSPGTAGYRFDGPVPPPLGAVDITHPGRVWLHEALTEADRAAVGCAAAAILLEPRPRTPSADELPERIGPPSY